MGAHFTTEINPRHYYPAIDQCHICFACEPFGNRHQAKDLLEIAIKQKIGKLPELPISISELEKVILADGFGLIPISAAHGNFKIYEKIISLIEA